MVRAPPPARNINIVMRYTCACVCVCVNQMSVNKKPGYVGSTSSSSSSSLRCLQSTEAFPKSPETLNLIPSFVAEIFTVSPIIVISLYIIHIPDVDTHTCVRYAVASCVHIHTLSENKECDRVKEKACVECRSRFPIECETCKSARIP
jgi:hypothetical protein